MSLTIRWLVYSPILITILPNLIVINMMWWPQQSVKLHKLLLVSWTDRGRADTLMMLLQDLQVCVYIRGEDVCTQVSHRFEEQSFTLNVKFDFSYSLLLCGCVFTWRCVLWVPLRVPAYSQKFAKQTRACLTCKIALTWSLVLGKDNKLR